MAEDGKIIYKIVLDDTGVEEQAEQSGDKAGKSFGQAAVEKLKSVGKAIGAAGAAVGTAVIATGTALARQTEQLAEYGDHIDKMSQKLGMSAEAYQEWDAILQHSGASIDALEPTMKSLFQAAQDGSDAFTALGISQEEAAKMSQEDLFSATITALQNVTDENEKAALAQELLGRGAQELAPLLNTSAQETELMRKRVHELGGVMSNEAVKNAAAYQDTLQDMKTAMQGMSNQLVSEFLPDITSIMEGITEIFSGDSEKGIGMVTKGLNDMLGKIVQMLPDILKVGTEIVTSLLDGLISNLPSIIDTGIEILLTLIDGIVAALPSLINAVPQIISSLVTGLLSHLPQLVTSGLQLLLAVRKGLVQAIPQVLAMLQQIILQLISAFRNTDWSSIGTNIVQGIWNGITGLWNSLVDAVRNAVNNLWQSAKQALGIASPSKKFKYIGEMTTEGTIEGIEDTQAEMTRTVTDVYSGMSEAASDALTRDMSDFERDVSYNVTASGKMPDMTIVVPLSLDGREIARATAWSMGEQLAWEEM